LVLALAALGATSCEETQRPSSTEKDAGKPSPAPPPKPPPPWYVGTWQGSFEVGVYRIPEQPGAVRNWAKDDGGVGTGRVSLSVTLDESRTAHGRAEGALGTLSASGELDAETLRLRLTPAAEQTPDAQAPDAGPRFSGFVIATRQGEAFVGNLRASSSDSFTVRSAKLELSKALKPPAHQRP
jgi:hypothetical protein